MPATILRHLGCSSAAGPVSTNAEFRSEAGESKEHEVCTEGAAIGRLQWSAVPCLCCLSDCE